LKSSQELQEYVLKNWEFFKKFKVTCPDLNNATQGQIGWPPFGHESIEQEPLTALEQWKASRHRSLWLVVSN